MSSLWGCLAHPRTFLKEECGKKGGGDHYIGVATTKECPDNLTQLEVAASTWAVFEAVGSFPDTLQDVWGRIYSEWFPSQTMNK